MIPIRYKRFIFLFLMSILSLTVSLPVQAEGGDVPEPPVICIDPGHQRYANNDPEPIGPDAAETKPKVSSGTQGVVTKKPEYVLTLEASLRMKEKLQERGYRVVMTREDHDVDLSNRERADIANAANADLFLRIHADGDTSSRTKGISVLYPSPASQYTKAIYEKSRKAAAFLLDSLVAKTGAQSRGSVPRNDITGFNWSTMPTVLVEMGFMTNPEEDVKLSEPDYQNQIAEGIADGVDSYFRNMNLKQPAMTLDAAVTLLAHTELFDKDGDTFSRTGVALSAQTVHALERVGWWYRIETWLGDKWVFAPRVLTSVAAANQEVLLENPTFIRMLPFPDARIVGQLSPQTVHVFEEWNGWLHVHSWLGDVWVDTQS